MRLACDAREHTHTHTHSANSVTCNHEHGIEIHSIQFLPYLVYNRLSISICTSGRNYYRVSIHLKPLEWFSIWIRFGSPPGLYSTCGFARSFVCVCVCVSVYALMCAYINGPEVCGLNPSVWIEALAR